MPEITEVIAAGEARVIALNQERAELLKSAEAHELAARADRLKANECKAEAASIAKTLEGSRAVRAVELTQAAAEKAKAEAEASKAQAEAVKAEADATLARLKEQEAAFEAKSKQVDELLAKAEAAQPKA